MVAEERPTPGRSQRWRAVFLLLGIALGAVVVIGGLFLLLEGGLESLGGFFSGEG